MEDDKIKDLFGNFNPGLSDEFQFMKRLERSMDAVEIVRRQNLAMRHRSRKALCIAAIAGFAAGIIFALFMPVLWTWIQSISINIPHVATDIVSANYRVIGWVLLAAFSIVISLNTYDIVMSHSAVDHLKDK